MSRIYDKEVRIIAQQKVGQRYYRLLLDAPDIARKAVPGQFVQIRITNGLAPLLRRPLSIHNLQGGRLELFYAVVGKGSGALSAKRAGDTLGIIGPLGNGFDLDQSAGALPVLVAGGMGVAPLYFLAKKITRNRPLILIGAKNSSELAGIERFKDCHAKVCVSTDDGSRGTRGYVTDLLKNKLTSLRGCRIALYACGPRPMLKEVCRIAKSSGFRAQVSLEEHMSCGFGACLGCVVKTTDGYQRVCKEGPVFDACKIIW